MFRDSEKTYYPKISQRRKGAKAQRKARRAGFPRFSLRLCASARDIKWGNVFFPSPLSYYHHSHSTTTANLRLF